MKTYRVTTLVAVILTATSLTIKAQELTDEQRAEVTRAKVNMERAQAETETRASGKARSTEAYFAADWLLRRLHEAEFEPRDPATLEAANETQLTASLSLMENQGEGGEQSQSLMGESCGQNTNIFYNLPPFEGWNTTDSPPYERPWFLSETTVPPHTNGYGAESYPNYLYSTYQTRSTLQHPFVNHYDMYGDPVAHTLSFTYKFSIDTFGDAFWCNVSYINYLQGVARTNLAPTLGAWKRVSLFVPPQTNIAAPEIFFVVFRGGTQQYTGPQANLDPSVAWCPMDTPLTNLRIAPQGTNHVQVSWDIPSYGTNRWSLEYAALVQGTYATYTGPIVTSNGVASATFGKTNDARFYRLKHL